MPTLAFDSLEKAGFAGFIFPVSEITVTGGFRDHVHEYPHSPGGAPEKLGRKLYEFKFKCPFTQGLKGYPLLWPETLASLRIIFEGGRSFDLVVPTIGTITAYCTAWTETATPQKNRKGVEAEFTFREDQSEQFLVDKLVTKTVADAKGAVAAYQAALTDQRSRSDQAYAYLVQPDALMLAPIPPEEDALFDEVMSVAASLFAALATAVGFGFAIAELALSLAALCQNLCDNSQTLQDPTRWELLYALQQVWAAAQQVATQAKQTNVRRVEYAVPQTMSIGQVSTAIYGDASHAMELLQMNAIASPFAVPRGTIVKAYVFDQSTAIASAA